MEELCGPILYPGMRAEVTRDGVEATTVEFDGNCAKPGSWQANWIWLSQEPGDLVAAAIRKEIVLAAPPRQVRAWISADRKYRLYINGRLVGRGPVDIGRDYHGGGTDRWFYDCCDLTPYFTQGTNTIAVEVFRKWPIGWAVTRGQNGLLFEADIELQNGSRQAIKTDTTWRGSPAAFYQGDGQVYDSVLDPKGWRSSGFDDSQWANCVAVADVWQQPVPSQIPPLMEIRYPISRIDQVQGGIELPAEPLAQGQSIRVRADGSFQVVFDRVLSAYPVIRVRGGRGAVVRLKCTRDATIKLDGREHAFEFPFMDEVVPALTVEVSQVTEPLEITDVGAIFTSQPVPYRGSFACSDPLLNRLWTVSRWANQICLQTHHLDSPNHQEPISDPGDYLIEAMVTYYAHGVPWLARQDLRKFAWLLKNENYHNFHTSYSLGWLQMLMDYYDFTGDRRLVDELAPYAHELLDTYETWRGRNGLISQAPNYMFMDWVEIAGFGCHHPPAVIGQGYLTAFYYHGLEQGIRLAAMAGDAERAAKYARFRRLTAEAFERELWDCGRGLYRDGKPFQTSVRPYEWLPEDKLIETFSPHVNLLAVLYDLAPRQRHREIVERVMADGRPNTQPWFMHWVFQAIAHAGLYDRYGTQQMRRWQVAEATQSFREMWASGDLSHGWCSTPLVQMSSVILGVRPTSPGFESIAIRPTLCDLRWAKGIVPTPHGDVAVAWERSDSSLRVDVTVPTDTLATLELPALGLVTSNIEVDGRGVGQASSLLLEAGSHRIAVAAV